MRPRESWVLRAATRAEAWVFGQGWAVSLIRALPVRPTVRTVTYAVPVERWPDTPSLRIAFASDFHAGPTTDPEVIRIACAALAASSPDVLLLGGDYVNLSASGIDWLAAELAQIPAPLGRFAVLGNHDRWSGASHIIDRLKAASIQILVNSNVQLQSPYDHVWICGLDDHSSGDPSASAAVLGATGVRVVLMHSPSGLLDMGSERYDLALCGHTHGGQVALPGGIPILVPGGRFCRRYARGHFRIGGRGTMVVSVGVGCVGVPFRLFAAPEIVICDLKPEQVGISAPTLSGGINYAVVARGMNE